MKVYAVYNIKGGVGKTATAVNLAWLSARAGARTLLWDLDPQGAATFIFRIRPKVKGGARALVSGELSLNQAMRGSDFEGLDVVPADFSNRNLDLVLEQVRRPEHRIKKLLEPLRDHYDHVFLDCAPSVSLVSENVFEAAEALLIPTIPTPLSLRTLAQLMRHLKRRRGRRPAVFPFFCMRDRRKNVHKRVIEYARANRLGFLEAEIPYASAVEQMAIRRSPLHAFAPKNEAAVAYEALWRETLDRIALTHGWRAPSSKLLKDVLSDVRNAGRTGASGKVQRPVMGERRETEFKLRVHGDDAFRALVRTLIGPDADVPPAVRQKNHFFDTPNRSLSRAELVLRLREESGRSILTAKGPSSATSDAALVKKAEEEVEISTDDKEDVLAGRRSPLELLAQRLGERHDEPTPKLIGDLRAAVDGAPLAELGSFCNDRARLGPVHVSAGGEELDLTFELDRTEFPGDRVDHEVEIEVAEELAERSRTALRAIFAEAGLEWSTAPSKATRFFAALEGREL